MDNVSRRRVPAFIVLLVALALAKTWAQSSTWYVATNGSNSSSCGSSTAPCATVSYVLTNKVNTGDTVIVSPGTYTDSTITLTGTKHQNVTITSTPAVVSALGTFTRGRPSGTDNRPLFSATRFQVSASGVRLSYLRIRNAAAPFTGSYDGVVGVSATGVTIDHNEIYNGNQGVQVNVKRLVTIDENYIHDTGSMSSTLDSHGVSVCGTGTIAAGWSEAVTISNNSIERAGGDAVQEMTNGYCSGTFQYLVIANNDLHNSREQGFDSKGTSDVRIYGNNIYENGEGGIVATNDPVVVSKDRWEIYGNVFHDHDNYAIAWAQNKNCSAWKIYNNVFYNNVRRPAYNYAAVQLCGDSGTLFYSNVLYNNVDSGSTHSAALADFGSGANVKNNIFYNNGTGSDDWGNIRSSAGDDSGTPSFNYVYPTGKGQAGSNAVSTCMTTGNCAGFVNAAAHDFHLLAGAPVIDKGTALAAAYAIDFDNRARPQGASWDIGAYEGTGGGTTITAPPAAPSNVRIIR